MGSLRTASAAAVGTIQVYSGSCTPRESAALCPADQRQRSLSSWDISPPGSTSTRLLPGLGKVGPGCAPLPGATGRPLRRGKRAYEHAGVLCWRSVGLREPTAVPSVTERQER